MTPVFSRTKRNKVLQKKMSMNNGQCQWHCPTNDPTWNRHPVPLVVSSFIVLMKQTVLQETSSAIDEWCPWHHPLQFK
jgi:hypothetical protein